MDIDSVVVMTHRERYQVNREMTNKSSVLERIMIDEIFEMYYGER